MLTLTSLDDKAGSSQKKNPNTKPRARNDEQQQASESRLYTFSQESKDHLRKFRLGTSRSNDPQAVIYYIDKNTLEIKQDEEKIVYKDLQEIADELPDHSPRYVLLSYPLTLPSGRLSVPYVLLYYLPATCNAELRMLYAGAKELMRNTAEVGKVLEIDSADDLEDVPKKLGAE
ncbi:Glia maturation factor beta [Coleophoma cylindrospora]|uniref:Glia maturation factor beta n=1 Tax=Coleophoma cylindrospora TaxID=1849047 RepID=A0A3D8R607_9HELO|nr:Glia maturation factor beta [Coleophoma cylindrospora]